MKRRWMVSFALVAAVLAACEKDRAAGSGSFDAADQALFRYLPTGSTLLFGGNYMKLQNFMQSSMGQLSSVLVEKMGPGMSAWMTCFADMNKLKLAAAVDFGGKEAQLRMVFSGMSLDDIAGCAQKASFKTTLDADHKFMTVELPPPAATSGYLVLPSGALYNRQAFALAVVPTAVSATRPELEADIAALGKVTAADDPAMLPLIGKVDRTKTVWFIGSAANTPLADKVGEVWGTMDLASGLAMDVTVQVKDKGDADKVEQGVDQLRKMADQVPGDFKNVIKNIRLDRHGDRLRFGIAISDAELKSMVSQFGGMLGGALGGAH